MIGLVNAALLAVVTIGSVTAGVLSAALFHGIDPVEFVWASEDEEGRLVEVCEPHILDRPLISLAALADLTAEAITELNDFDYLDWDTRIPAVAEAYFTPQAARSYVSAFGTSRLLRRVQDEYYTVQGQLRGRPVVVSIRDDEAERSWTVEVPVRVHYITGATEDRTRGRERVSRRDHDLLYRMRIVEQRPTEANGRGVGIADLSVHPLDPDWEDQGLHEDEGLGTMAEGTSIDG